MTKGILGGHFDLETACPIRSKNVSNPFPEEQGTVTYHVHEYDKTNQTTTVDFFKMKNTSNKPSGTSTSNKQTGSFDQMGSALSGKRFHLIVVNAPINIGGILSINGGAPIRVTQFQNDNQALLASGGGGSKLPIYTVGRSAEGEITLTSLLLAFDPNVPANKLLAPTSPLDCVIPNHTGPHGEYRDGALVIQAIDINAFQLGINGAATVNGGLLWEGIVFNHYDYGGNDDPYDDVCYGDLLLQGLTN